MLSCRNAEVVMVRERLEPLFQNITYPIPLLFAAARTTLQVSWQLKMFGSLSLYRQELSVAT